MKELPKLQWHKKSCYTCRYYRVQNITLQSDCLFLGRLLSMTGKAESGRSRFCAGWKRRPKNWCIYVDGNPYYDDPYIKRKTLQNIRTRWRLK